MAELIKVSLAILVFTGLCLLIMKFGEDFILF